MRTRPTLRTRRRPSRRPCLHILMLHSMVSQSLPSHPHRHERGDGMDPQYPAHGLLQTRRVRNQEEDLLPAGTPRTGLSARFQRTRPMAKAETNRPPQTQPPRKMDQYSNSHHLNYRSRCSSFTAKAGQIGSRCRFRNAQAVLCALLPRPCFWSTARRMRVEREAIRMT